MESVELDMEDIMDDAPDDDDIGAVGTLPDLPEATQEDEEEDNVEVLARLKDLSKGAAKKVIRRPQPKLDSDRLTGERGIPILPQVFKNIKFKGKGHEAHDLGVLMRQLEHWTHRLYPKMPFDEVIERLERLGNKKQVQTCVKKIRLDLPVLDDQFIGDDRNSSDEEPTREPAGEPSEMPEENDDDLWDRLLNEEKEASQVLVDVTAATGNHGAAGGAASSENFSSPERASSQAVSSATPSQTRANMSNGLTPEQLERIERNKQMARDRRMKKHGIFSPASQKTPEYTAIPLSQYNSQTGPTSSSQGGECRPKDATPVSSDDKISQREATLLPQDGIDSEMETLLENDIDSPSEKSVAASSQQDQVSEREANYLSQADTVDSQREAPSFSQGDADSQIKATLVSNSAMDMGEPNSVDQTEMETEPDTYDTHGATANQNELSEVLPQGTSQNITVGETAGQSEMSDVLPPATSQNIKVGEASGQSEMSEVLPPATNQNIKVGEASGQSEMSEVLPPGTSQNIKVACPDQEDGQNWCTEGETTQDSGKNTMLNTPSTEQV